MQLLHEDETNQWLLNAGWIEGISDRIRSTLPLRGFRAAYDVSGVVGANMAELFLSEFLDVEVSSGLLRIVRISPPDRAPLTVFEHLLKSWGHPNVGLGNFRYLYSTEYERLLTTMAWCMTCEWDFNFFATDRRYALSTDEDSRITVYWNEREHLNPDALRIFDNQEFEEVIIG